MKITNLDVSLDFGTKQYHVGRLAVKQDQIWFEYDADFIETGLEISPFKLALEPYARQCSDKVFNGLWGVFNDSLPDAWGELLLNRRLRQLGLELESLTPLDRLAMTGTMGALVYKPVTELDSEKTVDIDLDSIARETELVLEGSNSEMIEDLLKLGASSGGARPKISIYIDDDNYSSCLRHDYQALLVKFAYRYDAKDIGAIEYAYSLMAKAAGLEMMPCRLLEGRYFATQRFDRGADGARLHMHSAAGLLHADHHYPSLDYDDLLKATLLLTKSQAEVDKLYRLMVFNVLAHNRDDHSKNFSYLMDADGNWRLAPAYDLTCSSGPGGEHSMTLLGEGREPGAQQFAELARRHNIDTTVVEEVEEAVSNWSDYADEAGVSKQSKAEIAKKLR